MKPAAVAKRFRVTGWCIVAALTFAAGAIAAGACAEIGTSASEPAAIEFSPFAAPAIVLGDSLRDIDGVAAPAHAIVRNVRGDIIPDARALYLYADFTRDTALLVDSLTGFITAQRAFKSGASSGRVVARAGTSLQLIRTIQITTRPDSADRKNQAATDTLRTSLPDTGRAGAISNTSTPVTLFVRHIEAADNVTPVNGWLVHFELIQPANATNDSTQSVFLVDEAYRPSALDTTDASGTAARQVRVRAASFPAGTAPDSVVVRATIRYKGVNVKGSPIRVVVPVRKR